MEIVAILLAGFAGGILATLLRDRWRRARPPASTPEADPLSPESVAQERRRIEARLGMHPSFRTLPESTRKAAAEEIAALARIHLGERRRSL